MTSEAEKKPEISDPSDEIIRNVKRSGVFDKIKRNVLEDLQELVCFFRYFSITLLLFRTKLKYPKIIC
jgi:hypothetical protein